MMSQKSLRNKVNRKDFSNSLLNSIIFPVIALVALSVEFTLPVIQYFMSESFAKAQFHDELLTFLPEYNLFVPELFPAGMTICGILTAMKSFSFIMSKKQVNVYLSLGVSRATMFLNRFAAGAIMLFIAVLIPFTTTYIFNIAYLGISAQLTSVYLYLIFLFSVSGLVGLAIGSFACAVSGHLFEAGLTSFSLSVLPILAAGTFHDMMNNFLKGATYRYDDFFLMVFTPFSFGRDISAKPVPYSNPINTYERPLTEIMSALHFEGAAPKNFKVPEELIIDRWWILPVVIWFAVAIVLTIGGLFLFKRRRAEHANSFGHFKVATAINSTMVFACVTAFIINAMPATNIMAMMMYEETDSIVDQPIFWFIMLPIATFIAYFLAQLIMKRKIKPVLKSLSLYGVLVAVVAVELIAVGTELFGTYNRLPEKTEVKNVRINVHGIVDNYVLDSTDIGAPMNFISVESDDSADIEMVLKVFDRVRSDKKNGNDIISAVKFLITEKDGDTMLREFPIYSEEVYLDYMRAVYDSNYFDIILRQYLIDDLKPQEETNDFSAMDTEAMSLSYRDRYWFYYDSSFLSEIKSEKVSESYPDGASLDKENRETACKNQIADVDAFCKALYEDLSKMDFDSICRNPKRPIGAITTGGDPVMAADFLLKDSNNTDYDMGISYYYDNENPIEMEFITSVGYTTVYLYPEMTNTLKFLEDNGFLSMVTYDGKIEEVLYSDSPINFDKVGGQFILDNYNDKDILFGAKFSGNGDVLFFNMNSEIRYSTPNGVAKFFDANATLTDYIKKAYANYEHPLTSVKDTETINKVINATVPYYTVLSDKGRYVYVIYEDGPILCYYLPEANAGILK